MMSRRGVNLNFRRGLKADRRFRRDLRRYARQAYGLMPKQLHFKDNAINASAIGTSAGPNVFSIVAGIAQDDSSSGRSGRKVYLRELGIHWTCARDNDILTSSMVTAVIVLDKQANGSTGPTYAELFDSSGEDELAFRNLDNVDRYKILKKWQFTMQNTAGAWDGVNDKFTGNNRFFRWYKKWGGRGMPITYSIGNTDGVSTAIKDNNIWMMIFADNANCTVTATTRVRFEP